MQLRDYLTSKDVTPAQFADRIGVSLVTVNRYLAGTRRPEWHVLGRIVKATDGLVTANDFLADQIDEHSSVGNRRRPPSEAVAAV